MPVIAEPEPTVIVPPGIYRITGLSMHNVAEPVTTLSWVDPETGEVQTGPAANGYMVVEWQAGDEVDGVFVERRRGTTRIQGEAFLAYLEDRVGAAIGALLKLYLHQAMIELGMFPAGQNVMTPTELAAIASFCGWFLSTYNPPRQATARRYLERIMTS